MRAYATVAIGYEQTGPRGYTPIHVLDEAHSKDVNEANSGSAAPFADQVQTLRASTDSSLPGCENEDVVVRMFTGSGNPVRSGELTAFYIMFTYLPQPTAFSYERKKRAVAASSSTAART